MSAFALRAIALLCMLLDHVGVILPLPHPLLRLFLRAIGRLSFPLFAFLIANGYRHTKSRRRYALRLLALALFSEPFFDLSLRGRLWDPSAQNVFFTLLLGLLAITVFEALERRGALLALLASVGVILVADLLKSDYGALGAALILGFHFAKRKPLPTALLLSCFSLFDLARFYARFVGARLPFFSYFVSVPPTSPIPSTWSLVKIAALLALPLLLCYNGKKGYSPRAPWAAKLLQLFLYLFYPLHLLLLWCLA